MISREKEEQPTVSWYFRAISSSFPAEQEHMWVLLITEINHPMTACGLHQLSMVMTGGWFINRYTHTI